MKMSTDRILTTHVGSLPRPPDLSELLALEDQGGAVDRSGLQTRVAAAVTETVASQVELGIDVVSDGEMSKIGYATYIKDRCEGFSGDSARRPPADLAAYPHYMQKSSDMGQAPKITRPVCSGEIRIKG